MGREIKRVPLDFDWKLNEVWSGYLMPESLHGRDCEACGGRGYSPEALRLQGRWYGNVPFHPGETGSAVLTPQTPAVRAFAERNVSRSPEYYGSSERSIVREAQRLCDLWNGCWSHHLAQEDVDALIAAGRLMDFTHTWTKTDRWQPRDPMPEVTAAQVNEWSIGGMGHDSINCSIVVGAKCKAEGYPERCHVCEGHGSLEVYPGQRDDAEAWEREEPPTGDGWQVWETVSEGSPISPVQASREDLIAWLMSPEYRWGVSTPLTREQAEHFVGDAWAPSLVSTSAGVIPGEQFLPPSPSLAVAIEEETT